MNYNFTLFKDRFNDGACFNCFPLYFFENAELKKNSFCMECGTSESLRFCLECTHVGCGHSTNGHALDHYKISKHMWVMDVEKFKIWDYEKSQYLQHNLDVAKLLRNHRSSVSTADDLHCQCPVCRHQQIPKLSKLSICMSCGGKENLWLCLNCSHIGCGRGARCHALDHYTRTNHCQVMQLKNFSIWDYKDNKYVHRLGNETPAEIKSEVKTENMPSLEDRMQRLENEWNTFCKLKETNQKMISIEQRLKSLCEEKQLLEEKLRAHDTKINELLTQFKDGNRNILRVSPASANQSPEEVITAKDVKNLRSSFLKSSSDSDEEHQSHTILFLILLLHVYHFVNLFK